MRYPRHAPLDRGRALVANAHEGLARTDKDFLRHAGYWPVLTLNTLNDTLSELRRGGAAIVLCDHKLRDGHGHDLARVIIEDPDLPVTPVVMVSSKDKPDEVLHALEAGCVGYLLRPYSQESFLRQVKLARSLGCLDNRARSAAGRMKHRYLARDAEEQAGRLNRNLARAARCLSAGRHAEARDVYEQILREHPERLDVLMALAETAIYLDDDLLFRRRLRRAALLMMETGALDALREDLSDLVLQGGRFNPFHGLALEALRRRDCQGALALLREAARLTPEWPEIYVTTARVLKLLRRDKQAMKALERSLRLGETEEGKELFHRWAGFQWFDDVFLPGRRDRVAEPAPEAAPALDDSHGVSWWKRGKQALEAVGEGPDFTPALLNATLWVAGVVSEGVHRMRRATA